MQAGAPDRGQPDRGSGDEVVSRVENQLLQYFDAEPVRASVSFLGVSRIEVLRFPDVRAEPDRPGAVRYVSLGMSRTPMTSPTQTVFDDSGPRAELSLCARPGADAVWSKLAVLAAAPQVEGVVYVPGMTVDLGGPLVEGSRCSGVVVAGSVGEPIVTSLGEVLVLDVIAASATELAWCRVHGAAALQERWAAHQVDVTDLHRASVPLA